MVQLGAGESARVERGVDGDSQLVLSGEVGNPPKFVRRLIEPPKLLDLLDIVAGGNGTGNRRERGIDPVTGMEDPLYVPKYRGGDRQYWRVSWHKLIDGVFIPDGRAGAIQLDSAGHTFDGFPPTCGEAWGSIWARAAEVKQDKLKLAKNTIYWIYAMGSGEQFMPDRRGLLCFHANAGITFNLEAMRKMHPDVRPARFRATAGLVDGRFRKPSALGMADVWVFVDGRLKLKHMQLRPRDGTINVDVELGPHDRFLAIALTDGDANRSFDWVVIGDPVLLMTPTESEEK